MDLTHVNPFSFQSVFSSKTQFPIIDVGKDTRTQTVIIDGVEYEIPRSILASEDNSSQGFNRTFQDGTLAVSALQDDSALAYRLLYITTGNNSLFPLNKSLPTKNQYYFFVNDHAVYSGKLRDYLDFINEKELLQHVSKLTTFNAEDPDVVQAYVEFFNTVGSHFVSSTTFGARFQLQVWASNKYEEVNNNFVRDVTASVKGLNDGGNFDRTVFREQQYRIFNRISQRIIRIRGGNTNLADSLADSPDSSTFKQWTDSISGNPELVVFGASELWTLLLDADNATLRAIAGDLRSAFEYISSLGKGIPDDQHTWVTFEMESDQAEFGIVTANAVIGGGDSDQLALPRSLSLGPPKLHWGSSGATSQHIIAVFEVINDGTPIDIYISSGSGYAKVNILGESYETKGGIQWYSNVPVSS